jgi:hypothetical protein
LANNIKKRPSKIISMKRIHIIIKLKHAKKISIIIYLYFSVILIFQK